MHRHSAIRGPHVVLLALVLVLGAALLPGGQSPCAAKEWESHQDNVLVTIPDAPAPWEWLTFDPDWTKAGIIRGARRVLEKRKDGKDAQGEGALLHVVRRKLEAPQTVEEAAQSKDVRDFLLKRFDGTEEDLETDETTIASGTNKDGHPAIVLRAKGQARNLKGKMGSCAGVLIVAVAKGHLYLVRMYAFPTEFDPEGLEVDLDYMEGNCIELIDTKEEKTATPVQPPPEDGKDGQEPTPEGEGKDVIIENQAQKWRIVVDKKLTQIEITDEDREQDLVLKLSGADREGSYAIYLYAPPLGRIVDGQQLPAPNLVKWMTADWWKNFNTNHPEGDVFTFKWPKKTSQPTWLTFPDIGDPEMRVDVFTGSKKRPAEVDAGDMIKKYGCVEKPKKKNIGKKGKGSEALRGILQGNRPRVGTETVARYAWRTPTHSFRLFVTLTNDAHKKYSEPIRKTLESMEFGVKFE